MNNHEARKFVETVYHDIWAAEDLEKFATYYHPEVEFVGYDAGGEIRLDYQMIKNQAYNGPKIRKDVETTFEDVYAVADNKIIARFKMRYIVRANGRVFKLRTAFEYELKDGKIYRGWAIFNHNVPFDTKPIQHEKV